MRKKICAAFFTLTLCVGMATSAMAGCTDTSVAYKPSPDVAYQPGVDAEGWAVAPADLDEHAPLDITIDMDMLLENYVKKQAYNADISRMEIELGKARAREQGMEIPPSLAAKAHPCD